MSKEEYGSITTTELLEVLSKHFNRKVTGMKVFGQWIPDGLLEEGEKETSITYSYIKSEG